MSDQVSLKPGLYLIATPIGNLADISYRAVETLKCADVVYCEDTRVAAKLLSAFGIKAKTATYHEHNGERQRPKIQTAIESGQVVALISDAGMPLISDPGYKLVRELTSAGVFVTAVPGATATLTALQLSGLATDRFLFAGFLPQKEGARRSLMETFAQTPATLIFFDTGARVESSLKLALDVFGDRQAAIARELTKMFEEVLRGSLSDLMVGLNGRDRLRGEIVLLIDRIGARQVTQDQIDAALIDALKTLSTKQAAGQVADLFGLSKRDLYQRALTLNKPDK